MLSKERYGDNMFFSQFAQWDKYMVCEEPIQNVDVAGTVYGYEFYIHYPTYRGTYLSCIEELYFEVDGERIPDGDVEFHLNGKQFLLPELKELFAEYWHIREDAAIRIINYKGLEKGSVHRVKAHMQHRIPYTGYNGDYGVEISECEKELKVAL